jgi:hypothetical protein
MDYTGASLYQVLIAKYHPHLFVFCISVGQSLGVEIGVVFSGFV